MVYKKCPSCGESSVPVARKTCPSCGYNYKVECSTATGEGGGSAEDAKEEISKTSQELTSAIGIKDEDVKTEKKPVKEEEPIEEEEPDTRQSRPKRNVRKPHLLGDELAVAVAVESSFKSASKGKQAAGKRGAKAMCSSSGMRGGRGVKRSGILQRPSHSSNHAGTTTVRSLLAAQQQRKLQQQRKPRGRPRVGNQHAPSPGTSGSRYSADYDQHGSRDASSTSRHHSSRFSGAGKSSSSSSSTRGAHSSGGSFANGRGRGNNDDDDDDDDFGLTLHHKRQISESLDQTKGQRTRQLMPRRAASVSLSSLQLQQQQQRMIASAASDSPPRGSPASAAEMNEFLSGSDSNSPVSSKSASPCSPEMIEDRYERLPAYRRLQYSLVLGDINQKFLNQSFHPL